MMGWIDIGIRIWLVSIALLNVGLSVLLIQRHLALRRVQFLLGAICTQAFVLREWPFELSRALRMRVDITPEPDLDWIANEFERKRRHR